jgi:hypothetical protein
MFTADTLCASLDHSNLDVLEAHRWLLSAFQRDLLSALRDRILTYPERFERSPAYAQLAGLILMSAWPHRRRFCYCSIRNRFCGQWKLCPYCGYVKRRQLRLRFLSAFHRARWWFLTISFHGSMLMDAPDWCDLALYWGACRHAVRALVRERVFAGAIKVEEVSVLGLLPVEVRPHSHFLVAAGQVNADDVAELATLVSAYDLDQDLAGEDCGCDGDNVPMSWSPPLTSSPWSPQRTWVRS